MKQKTKTLPSLRITTPTWENIQSALNKLNENSLIELSLQDYRRLAYEFLSQKISLGEKIQLQK